MPISRKNLRRALYTRGTTQITAFAVTSRSNKRYPLTRADGRAYCAGGSALRLGSDRFWTPCCRFAPPTGSLQTLAVPPSSSKPFCICKHFTMSALKSQTFSTAGHCKKYQASTHDVCANSLNRNLIFPVDKKERLCLNDTNPRKTLTENLSFPSSDPESRRLVRAGAGG